MRLPHAGQALIPDDKLAGYVLNPGHPLGKHKATAFQSALGLTTRHVDALHAALLNAARTADAVLSRATPFGDLYVVDFMMEHAGRAASVRSVWIVRTDSTIPRLVTCFVDE